MDIIRSIPKWEDPEWIDYILTSSEDFLFPVKGKPSEVIEGKDHLYLCYRGQIRGRARIKGITWTDEPITVGRKKSFEIGPGWCIVTSGPWEKPPASIHWQCRVGIRYTEPLW